jgi:hypothetical protein
MGLWKILKHCLVKIKIKCSSKCCQSSCSSEIDTNDHDNEFEPRCRIATI